MARRVLESSLHSDTLSESISVNGREQELRPRYKEEYWEWREGEEVLGLIPFKNQGKYWARITN